MNTVAERAPTAETLLDWLATAPQPLTPGLLPSIRIQLARLDRISVSDPQFRAILREFDARIDALTQGMRPELHRISLPLTRTQRAQCVDLADVLGQLAACHFRLMSGQTESYHAHRCINALYRRLEVCSAGGMVAPPLLWLNAHEAFHYLDNLSGPADDDASLGRLAYFRLLALGSTQPQRLSAAELGQVVNWLDESHVMLTLHRTRPEDTEETWYWVDLTEDFGPEQLGRRTPGGTMPTLFFSLAPYASHALASAAMPETALAEDATEEDAPNAALLRRLVELWSATHKRLMSRRRNNYRVAVCIGLENVVQLLEHHPTGMAEDAPELSEWMVLNESAGGYAMMHVGGHVEGILSGGVVALRAGANDAWTICLIRWTRSDNPEHVELGLQILSQGAQSVSVAFRSPRTTAVAPALMLPPLPAVRPKYAIIAPASTYTARRFVLIAQTERLYVTQGRVLSLDVQTAAIELFQFDLDPYPI